MIRTLALTAVLAGAAVSAVSAEDEREKEPPRMVVANFRAATGDSFYWNGQAESSGRWVTTLADRLNQRFTQMRQFRMIDRKFDAEVQDEIARLSDKNAAKADVIRLGQRIGTDYLTVGEVRFSSEQKPAAVANPIIGQAIALPPSRFAEISYRIVHAPTGEIVSADTITLDYGEFRVGDMFSFISASTDAASLQVAESVLAALSPASAPVPAPAAATPQGAPSAPPPVELNTTIRGTGNGGVVTPF